MTKQEEIREGLYDLIKKDFMGCWFLKIPTRWLINKILNYLDSQGVVIKVDRELPNIQFIKGNQAFVDVVKKAGLVAVVPLVEEK